MRHLTARFRLHVVCLLTLLTGSSLPLGHTAKAGGKTDLLASTGKALEDQLACLVPPKPGLAIRAMLKDRVIEKTKFGADGSPVFRPTGTVTVFGSKVLFLSGWEMEAGRVRQPFSRGPGTMPPLFLSVVLDTVPGKVPYREHMVRGADGVAIGSFSSIEATHEAYSKGTTTIICYGG